jgi:uncharacterized protein
VSAAIVTGATAGIGAEYARRLAERGHDLVLVGRRVARLEVMAGELAARHGVRAEPLPADLADPAARAAVATRAAGDDVELLVNSAGINGYGPFAEADPAVLDTVLQVNVVAAVQLTRAALPGLLAREAGAIVNVASLLAFAGSRPPDPLPWRATYAGTKGFIVTFSRTLAAEVADTPVRVQVLCPGYTATEFHSTNGAAPVADDAPAQVRPRAMAAEDVVRASLVALEHGDVVCVPGETEPEAISRLEAAEAGVLAADFSAPAARYLA